jgi:hypothetical protein
MKRLFHIEFNRESVARSVVILIITGFVFMASVSAQVAVSGAGASDGIYSTLGDAFNSINLHSHSENNILIEITENTTETYSIIIAQNNWNQLQIKPVGGARTILGNIEGSLILLDGASNVMIDGENGLTIENTNSSSEASTIAFQNGASYNLITRCHIKGATQPASTIDENARGVIFFGQTNNAEGNSHNEISYCHISSSGVNTPWCLVYSFGSDNSLKFNSQNTIAHCNLFDYFYNFASGSVCCTFDAGVYLGAQGNAGWNISGNSFYQTQERNKSSNNTGNNTSAIYIASGSGHAISENYIGGSDSFAEGNPMTYTGSTYQFIAVKIAGGNIDYDYLNSIENNVIANIDFTSGNTITSSSNNVPRFSAIHVGQGKLICNNNTIGSDNLNGSIKITQTNNVLSIYDLLVVSAQSNHIVNVEKCNRNTIAGINISARNFDCRAIYVQSFNGNSIDSLSYNTIGSATQANSIQLSLATASVSRNTFWGINAGGTIGGEKIISHNRVSNIVRGASSGNSGMGGVFSFMNQATIEFNTIQSIHDLSGNTMSWYGIYSSGNNSKIHNNFVANIGSTQASTQIISGILANGAGAVITNNIVALGTDANGNSYGARSFAGIRVGSSAVAYFNTVNIAGVCSVASRNSYAYYETMNSNARVYKNNLFVNQRTNNGVASQHYAMFLSSATNLVTDYNNYHVSDDGLIAYLSSDISTLSELQTATSGDLNSQIFNPDFLNVSGNSFLDFKPKATFLPGQTMADYATDFSGENRTNPPTIGALEAYNLWVGTVNTDFANTANWSKGLVPLSSETIVFSSVPFNNCLLDQDRAVQNIVINQENYYLCANGHKLTIEGDLILSNQARINASNGVVEFSGSALQQIPANAFLNNEVEKLIINNSNHLELHGFLNVADEIEFRIGKLRIFEDDLMAGGVSGADFASYIQTTGVGNLWQNISLNNTKTFPLGNATFNPLQITNNSGADDIFKVRVLDEVYEYGDSGAVMEIPRVKRTWMIDNTDSNAGSGVDFIFYWNEEDVSDNLNGPSLYHYNGSSWVNEGATAYSNTNLMILNYTGTFSAFTVGDGGFALPVEWLNISAQSINALEIKVAWATATEVNNDFFEVERSIDGREFTSIGVVYSSGNNSFKTNYTFIDNEPLQGVNYYRIKQIDFNQEYTYSKVVSSEILEANNFAIYPNPVSDRLNVMSKNTIFGFIEFSLYDILGGKVLAFQNEVLPNTSAFIDVSMLNPGMYLLVGISNNKSILQEKIIVK